MNIALSNFDQDSESVKTACQKQKIEANIYDASHSTEEKIDCLIGGHKKHSCFTGESLVLTNKGYKQIRNIQVGDLVLTHNRRFKPVRRVIKQKARVCLFTPQFGIPFYVTPTHRFFTKANKESTPEWKPLKSLSEDANFATLIPKGYNDSKPPIKPIEFRYIGISIAVSNTNYIKRKRTIKYLNELYVNSGLKSIFSDYGYGFLSYEIPVDLLNVPSEYLTHFIRGYLVGKKFEFKNNNELYLDFIHEENCALFSFLVLKCLNFLPRVTFMYTNGSAKYRMFLPCYNHTTSYTELKNNDLFARGSYRRSGYYWQQCDSLTTFENDTTEKTVYDLTVADDESYTVNNLVVHNCSPQAEKNKSVLNEVNEFMKEVNRFNPKFFIFSCTDTLSKKKETSINDLFGFAPICINTKAFSSLNTKQWLWVGKEIDRQYSKVSVNLSFSTKRTLEELQPHGPPLSKQVLQSDKPLLAFYSEDNIGCFNLKGDYYASECSDKVLNPDDLLVVPLTVRSTVLKRIELSVPKNNKHIQNKEEFPVKLIDSIDFSAVCPKYSFDLLKIKDGKIEHSSSRLFKQTPNLPDGLYLLRNLSVYEVKYLLGFNNGSQTEKEVKTDLDTFGLISPEILSSTLLEIVHDLFGFEQDTYYQTDIFKQLGLFELE